MSGVNMQNAARNYSWQVTIRPSLLLAEPNACLIQGVCNGSVIGYPASKVRTLKLGYDDDDDDDDAVFSGWVILKILL